jgi:hypothetical protein
VSDSCAIRRIELATARVTTFAGVPTDCRHVDGPASAARFNATGGVWGDGTTLFVASFHTLRAVDMASGEIRTLAGDTLLYGNEDGRGMAARRSVRVVRFNLTLWRNQAPSIYRQMVSLFFFRFEIKLY